MKQIKFLLLILMALVTQGAWAQDTPIKPGEELQAGDNYIYIPSFTSAYSYSTDKSAYNLYKFETPYTCEFGIYANGLASLDKAFAIFDENGNYVEYSVNTMGNGYSCPVILEGHTTYYLGMRANQANKAQSASYYVQFQCAPHDHKYGEDGICTIEGCGEKAPVVLRPGMNYGIDCTYRSERYLFETDVTGILSLTATDSEDNEINDFRFLLLNEDGYVIFKNYMDSAPKRKVAGKTGFSVEAGKKYYFDFSNNNGTYNINIAVTPVCDHVIGDDGVCTECDESEFHFSDYYGILHYKATETGTLTVNVNSDKEVNINILEAEEESDEILSARKRAKANLPHESQYRMLVTEGKTYDIVLDACYLDENDELIYPEDFTASVDIDIKPFPSVVNGNNYVELESNENVFVIDVSEPSSIEVQFVGEGEVAYIGPELHGEWSESLKMEVNEGKCYIVVYAFHAGKGILGVKLEKLNFISTDGEIAEGNNKLNFEEDSNIYTFIPTKSGKAVFKIGTYNYVYDCEATFSILNKDKEVITSTEDSWYANLGCIVNAGETYYFTVDDPTEPANGDLQIDIYDYFTPATLTYDDDIPEITNGTYNVAFDGSHSGDPAYGASSMYSLKYIVPRTGKMIVYTNGEVDVCGGIYTNEESRPDDYAWAGSCGLHDFLYIRNVVEGESLIIGVNPRYSNVENETITLTVYTVEEDEEPVVIEELVIEDGKDLFESLAKNLDSTIPSLFTANKVTYQRAATTSKWGTVVLPYELKSNDKVAYYELTAADIPSRKLEFKKVETVAPNTPTVYRIISGDQFDASVEGPVTVELPEYLGDFKLYADTEVEDWYLDGWYYEATIDTQHDDYFFYDGEPDGTSIMYISGDKFWHAEGSVKVKPYRAIFETWGVEWDATSSAKSMTISFKDEDGSVTTIQSVMEENGEFTDIESIYDLNGRKIETMKRGINIIRTADGKTRKFIKK